jgi:hypothetical protein
LLSDIRATIIHHAGPIAAERLHSPSVVITPTAKPPGFRPAPPIAIVALFAGRLARWWLRSPRLGSGLHREAGLGRRGWQTRPKVAGHAHNKLVDGASRKGNAKPALGSSPLSIQRAISLRWRRCYRAWLASKISRYGVGVNWMTDRASL